MPQVANIDKIDYFSVQSLDVVAFLSYPNSPLRILTWISENKTCTVSPGIKTSDVYDRGFNLLHKVKWCKIWLWFEQKNCPKTLKVQLHFSWWNCKRKMFYVHSAILVEKISSHFVFDSSIPAISFISIFFQQF